MQKRIPGSPSDAQQNLPIEFAHCVHFHALAGLAARAGREVEFVGVQRADDFSAAGHAFAERALLVRTAVLRGEKLAVALAEDGDFFAADEVAAALAECDFSDAAEIGGRAHGNQPLFSATSRTRASSGALNCSGWAGTSASFHGST